MYLIIFVYSLLHNDYRTWDIVISVVDLYIQDCKDRQWESSPKMSLSVRFSAQQIPGNNFSYLKFIEKEFTGWGVWEAKIVEATLEFYCQFSSDILKSLKPKFYKKLSFIMKYNYNNIHL